MLDSGEHMLETLPENIDVGSYSFSFETWFVFLIYVLLDYVHFGIPLTVGDFDMAALPPPQPVDQLSDMDLRRRYLTYAGGFSKSDPIRSCLLLSWGTESRLKGSFENAKSLTDFYYSIRGLVLLKDQTSKVDVQPGDADRIFRSIKALGQSDGRWRLSSNNPQFSNSAAGNALEALNGVISLASPQIDHSLAELTRRQ